MADDAEGVEVAGAGGRMAESLLGADVVGRAEHLAVLGVPTGVEGAGDAEVGELHDTVGPHEDVGRLDVTVHDASLVGDAERERGLAEDRANLARLERRALCEDLGQRLAVDELHDEEGQAVVLAVVEDRGDVGVQEAGGVHGLVTEAEGEEALVVGVGAHDLDRDAALEHVVDAGPDIGHAPGGDPLLEAVALAEDESIVKTVHHSTHGLSDEGVRRSTSRRPSSAVMVRDRLGQLRQPMAFVETPLAPEARRVLTRWIALSNTATLADPAARRPRSVDRGHSSSRARGGI